MQVATHSGRTTQLNRRLKAALRSGALVGVEEVAAGHHRVGKRNFGVKSEQPEHLSGGLHGEVAIRAAIMPTSAVVEFNFDTKAWSDIGEIRPAKVVFDYPKK